MQLMVSPFYMYQIRFFSADFFGLHGVCRVCESVDLLSESLHLIPYTLISDQICLQLLGPYEQRRSLSEWLHGGSCTQDLNA